MKEKETFESMTEREIEVLKHIRIPKYKIPLKWY
jgi:hypothetical protein